jgi:hypothetical protein
MKLGVGIPAEQGEFPESSTAPLEEAVECPTDLAAWVCDRLFTGTATRVLHRLSQLADPIGLICSIAGHHRGSCVPRIEPTPG